MGLGLIEQKQFQNNSRLFKNEYDLLMHRIHLLENANLNLVKENHQQKSHIASLEHQLHKIGDAEEQRDWLLDELTSKIATIGEIRTDLLKRERLSAIGELSSRLAHDMRNPLAIIQNTIELIKMKHTDNISSELLNQFLIIDRATSRITFQLDEVLNFVRHAPLDIHKHSLLEIINASIFRIVIPDDVKISLPQSDVDFFCDSRKIESALSNLIMNSIQAMNNEGTVQIRFTDFEYHILVEVEDSGPGMSEETLRKIFDPLFTTKSRGTGLGLATVKNMIEEHHGEINVSLNPTVFSFSLPKNLQMSSSQSMSS